MPFTPFHFGPGVAIKAVIPAHFSLSVFCFAQVVVDAEVLVHMSRGETRLHQHLHTYAGALGVAAISLAVGWPLCQRLLRWWCAQANMPLREIYSLSAVITPIQAITGALLGSLTHVVLDSIMHADLRPWAPFNKSNVLYEIVHPGSLHLACVLLGVLGLWLCSKWKPGTL